MCDRVIVRLLSVHIIINCATFERKIMNWLVLRFPTPTNWTLYSVHLLKIFIVICYILPILNWKKKKLQLYRIFCWRQSPIRNWKWISPNQIDHFTFAYAIEIWNPKEIESRRMQDLKHFLYFDLLLDNFQSARPYEHRICLTRFETHDISNGISWMRGSIVQWKWYGKKTTLTQTHFAYRTRTLYSSMK